MGKSKKENQKIEDIKKLKKNIALNIYG